MNSHMNINVFSTYTMMIAIPLSVELDFSGDLKELDDVCTDPKNECTLVVSALDEDTLVKW